ncbi:TPA: hypothetical protein ACY3G5_001904 [Morganella morganii]|uniref:hypothetical protein n=1 Tax=Morganella morganii TaxID=582 RepID=UPI0003DBC862|nr:hypothetical protein [Morganella morganii]MBT0401016.1 hypothetical protein [Morganella morganii subsp. morganii]CDK68208.1 putative bacteriophage protein [Morganella morganii IS15]HCR4002920.1 hypothetical protein [Morganella morganii]
MPTVPTYNERQVSSSPLPSNGFSAQSSPEHFGAGLAQAGDQYINAFAEAKQRANVALSQDALLQVQEYADDLFNNPNTGLYTKQGKNAVGQSDEIMASISAKGQELFMQLPEGSREDVVKQFNVVKRQYANQAKSYELKEIQSFETSRNNGAVAGYAKSASDNFNNPQAFISFMALGRHNIIEFNRSRGVSEEEISAKIAEFDNQVAWTAAQNAMATDAMGTIGAVGEPSDLGGVSRSSTYYGGNVGSVKGMTQQGNINLMNRPKVQNEDGSVSTVRTISVGTDEGEVLLPTVSDDGKLLTDDEAIALYEKTGKHLGIFDNPDDATAYAEQLHNQQEQLYVQGGSEDRGSRNNNPGNIRISDNNWEGQIGDDGEFVRFASPEHGVRALGKNLITYRNKGVVTINQIISRWAPKKDGNDTEGYIKFVSGKMGVDPNVPIDVTDINTLKSITTAIMQQEGNHSISGEQIDAGLQAALGLTRLPEPDPSQYQSRGQTGKAVNAGGNAWWPMLTPVQQYQIRKQGEAIDKEQRRELAEDVSLTTENIYAATNEGLQPENVPSESTYIRAFGLNKGQRAYADVQEQLRYGSVISAARDLSPDGRVDVLEQHRPKDPDAPDFAAAQQRWERMRVKFDAFDKEWEAKQGVEMVTNAVNHGVPLDPNNKSNKAATDSYYAVNFSNLDLKDENQVAGVIKLVGSTGIIPTQLLSNLNAAAVTQDPKVVLPAADLVSRLYEKNPTAITGLSNEKQAFYLNIKQYQDAGVDGEKSIELAYNLAYNQTDALKMQIAAEQSTQPYKKERMNAADDFVSKQSSIFRIDPSATDTTPEAKRYLSDYESLFDINFRVTGGNADIAKKMTHQQIARRWSITEVNGKAQLMKYAPESLYPGGPAGWQARQWEEEKWKLKYGEEKEKLRSIKGKTSEVTGRVIGISDDTPKPKIGGDIILIADKDTPRNGDYAIFIRQDKDGIPNDQPYYDHAGKKMRYKPDLESYQPYQELVAQLNEEKIKSMQKGAARREFYDRHDELDKQYQQAHEQRVEKQKNYFSWGGNK